VCGAGAGSPRVTDRHNAIFKKLSNVIHKMC